MSAPPIVYVVEDDNSVRRALARLIRSCGLEAETFPTARAFLDHPLADRPACLVLDVRLPGPSGLDLQSTLLESGQGIPIVFISGHGDIPMSVRAMKRGAIDFLPKPFHDRDLLESIELALAKSRQLIADAKERAVLERRLQRLTPREREVLALVIRGMPNKQIADELGPAEKTIKVHRGRVMEKMQAGSVAELVRMTLSVGFPPGHRTKAS